MTMTSAEIRERFLKFFEGKDHTIVQSDLLVPQNDPTLLFTGAGMNQFKEQFMGKNITFSRAASCQKCLRTADVENVGKTPRHHTFFEMLGNFSFGDYFKKDAIKWGWEFMTREMSLPEEKLWISVYEEDEESYDIWLNEVKVPPERIVKLGPSDNFWPADAPAKGPNGPCGPCSEIFYDWGEGVGCGKKSCNPACDCERFVEVWNLVFTEFERKPDGSLEPLPNKNIDTGMGLERMTSVMQNVRTNFETDLFRAIVEEEKKLLGEKAKGMDKEALYLMADHIRAVTFSIADGVSPSNEKRGYVVRKLIRRAYLKGPREGAFLYNLVPVVARIMKDTYPEVEEKREHISAIIEEEEKKFNDTLSSAMPVFEEMASGTSKLKGSDIFKLVDTYGLPLDVIEEEAEERGLKLDAENFKKLMSERKEASRKGSDIKGEFIFQPDKFIDAPKPPCSEKLPLEATLEFILKEDGPSGEISEGEYAEVITNPQSTSFYAEAGGQVGDAGTIVNADKKMLITNTYNADGRKVFQVVAKKGSFKKGDLVTVDLSRDSKSDTARNHTATHLLQAALRMVLGEHVKQSGSFVDSKRLRFDFTHMKKLSDREIRKVEDIVNAWVKEGVSVKKEVKSLTEAKEDGALSFFGEKYADTVRVVSVGECSMELCGGTHVDNSGDIELIKITGESSVASGIRRIEAVTGENARTWIKEEVKRLLKDAEAAGPLELEKNLADYIEKVITGGIEIDYIAARDFDEKVKPALIKIKEDLERIAKKKKKEKETASFSEVKERVDTFYAQAEKIKKVSFISGILKEIDMQTLRKAAGYLEKKVSSGVILLGSSSKGKAYLICAVTGDIIDKGLSAKELVNSISKSIQGTGGGKDAFAQAGGSDPDGLKEAIEKAKLIIEQRG